MKRPLGVAVKTIAHPLSVEALEAIRNSSLIRALEPNPVNFACEGGRVLQERFAELTRARGISTATYHCSFGTRQDLSSIDGGIRRGAVDNIYAEFSQARDLRAEIIVLHPSFEPVPAADRTARIKALRLSLSEIEERMHKYGYRLALELLPRTCLGNTADELWEIVDDFDDDFGFCLDVNHLMADIAGIPAAVHKLSHRLYALHISDYMGEDECHFMPGEGRIDWKAFTRALDDVGYNGPFTYELRLEGSPAERVRAIEENYARFFA